MRSFAALAVAFAATAAHAEVRLHGLFTDRMVLQRDASVRVWGWAHAGEAISVSFRQQRIRTTTQPNGAWAVRLQAEAAGGPDVLTVRGTNAVEVNDVLVGEVWLATGQSNMEWLLKDSADAASEMAGADRPHIRHIKIARRVAFAPQDDIETAAWQVSTPATAGNFSAIAYHFAKKMHAELGVPIGLINVTWGGTHIETWMSREALLMHRELRDLVPKLPTSAPAFASAHRARMTALVRRWQSDFTEGENVSAWQDPSTPDTHWKTLNAPGIWEEQGLEGFDGRLWYRRALDLTRDEANESATLQLGMIDDCDEAFVNGQKVGGLCGWDRQRKYQIAPGILQAGRNVIAVRVRDDGGGGGFHGDAGNMKLILGKREISLAGAWRARVEAPLEKTQPYMNDLPTLAYNGMLNPVVGYGIRGALWYQGESNVPRAAQYESVFPALIHDWRQRWGQGDFPFLYVQLASFLPLRKNTLTGSSWAELREAQRKTLSAKNTGMAVTTDIGDANDIHPRNKREVGLRLARIAMQQVFGGKTESQGPTLANSRVVGACMYLRFNHVGQGLRVKGERLKGFTIADGSRQFQMADARLIDRNTVTVCHADIQKPKAVRSGWVDNPEENNLVNSEGLPASPFRTDDWERVTERKTFVL